MKLSCVVGRRAFGGKREADQARRISSGSVRGMDFYFKCIGEGHEEF